MSPGINHIANNVNKGDLNGSQKKGSSLTHTNQRIQVYPLLSYLTGET